MLSTDGSTAASNDARCPGRVGRPRRPRRTRDRCQQTRAGVACGGRGDYRPNRGATASPPSAENGCARCTRLRP
ncbi:hypothetical protein BRC96_08310 [Halobacteriales archaeon QS_6_64_34]|nr:MAG: hypothetical protein BRC96_08310 [Halobacteriales archaeon QS_6_64_34]